MQPSIQRGMPLCGQCRQNDKVTKTRHKLAGSLSQGSFWCNRCRHRFTLETQDGPVYYDGGKAYVQKNRRLFNWARFPRADVRRR